jgi:hypothetical protein
LTQGSKGRLCGVALHYARWEGREVGPYCAVEDDDGSESPSRGVITAPATDNSLMAGASCASSLPAGAFVVTMRLAQRCCRSYAAWIAAATVLAGAATIRRPEAAACMSHAAATGAEHCWLEQMLPLGQWSRAVTRECGRSLIATVAAVDDCGRTALVAWTITAGLRVSPSLAAAGFQEMSPALALDAASKGDAITGIKRADSASVNRCSISGDPAHPGERTTRWVRRSSQCACDHWIIAQVPLT